MRIEEILNNCEFIGSLIGTETFGLKLNFQFPCVINSTDLYIHSIPSQNLNTEIFLRLETIFNKISRLDETVLFQIKNELWNKYLWNCENTEPIIESEVKSTKQVNMEYYQIFNIEEIMGNTYLPDIDVLAINYNSDDKEIYWNLNFKSEWIGDGFLRVTINTNKEIDSEFHH